MLINNYLHNDSNFLKALHKSRINTKLTFLNFVKPSNCKKIIKSRFFEILFVSLFVDFENVIDYCCTKVNFLNRYIL